MLSYSTSAPEMATRTELLTELIRDTSRVIMAATRVLEVKQKIHVDEAALTNTIYNTTRTLIKRAAALEESMIALGVTPTGDAPLGIQIELLPELITNASAAIMAAAHAVIMQDAETDEDEGSILLNERLTTLGKSLWALGLCFEQLTDPRHQKSARVVKADKLNRLLKWHGTAQVRKDEHWAMLEKC